MVKTLNPHMINSLFPKRKFVKVFLRLFFILANIFLWMSMVHDCVVLTGLGPSSHTLNPLLRIAGQENIPQVYCKKNLIENKFVIWKHSKIPHKIDSHCQYKWVCCWIFNKFFSSNAFDEVKILTKHYFIIKFYLVIGLLCHTRQAKSLWASKFVHVKKCDFSIV
jgi:hypothetical protein